MYECNIAAAAYSSALDAAKMKSGAVERCHEICEMITVSVMTVRNINKLRDGGSHAEASQDHTKGSEEVRDLDEFVPAVVDCPKCTAKLPVSSGKSGTIRCPKCSHAFEVKT